MSNCVLSSFHWPIIPATAGSCGQPSCITSVRNCPWFFNSIWRSGKFTVNRTRVLETAKTSCRFHRWGSPDVLVDTRIRSRKSWANCSGCKTTFITIRCTSLIRRVRKITKSEYLLRHACLSVRPHRAVRLLDRFSWNFVFEYFSKICQEDSSFIKVWHNNGYYTCRLIYILLRIRHVSKS